MRRTKDDFPFIIKLVNEDTGDEQLATVRPSYTIDEIKQRCFPLEYMKGVTINMYYDKFKLRDVLDLATIGIIDEIVLTYEFIQNDHPVPRKLTFRDGEMRKAKQESMEEVRRREKLEEEERQYLAEVDDWYFDKQHKAPPKRKRHHDDEEDECEMCSELCINCITPKLIMLIFGWILLFFMGWRLFYPDEWGTGSSSVLIVVIIFYGFTCYNLIRTG